jgi:putative transport protein
MLDLLRGQPTLTLFLVLGFGYLIGRLRIGPVDLGAVTGTLLIALVLGRLGFTISPGAQAVGFALFIFAIGHQAGPHIVSILRTHGFRYLALSLTVAALAVATGAFAASMLSLPPGGLAGMLSGSLTATPLMASAQEAVRSGLAPLPAGSTAESVLTTICVAYAMTYVVGTAALVLVIKLLPRLARIDLAAEAQSVTPPQSVAPAAVDDDPRAAQTDMIGFSFGIALGSALGLLSLQVAGISFGLGSAGGLLLAGLLVGWLSGRRPTLGRFPAAARWILMELGMLIFICGVGLQAGPGIVEAFRATGAGLVASAVCVALLPALGGYAVGRWLLRLPPVLLMGALAGAMTNGPGLSVLVKEARSSTPALGYAGTYAFSSVLFTLIGTLLMVL